MDTTVADNTALHRFEVRVDGELAGFVAYRPLPAAYDFTHTEVEPAYEGKGVASTLIRRALDEMRSRGFGALPTCPFVRAFVERHADYLDLVPAGARRRYGLDATG